MTALELQTRLRLLQWERCLAATVGLDKAPHYAADLEDEIDSLTRSYVQVAVTEAAVLRAELFGAQFG
jgi:hypothetical protein